MQFWLKMYLFKKVKSRDYKQSYLTGLTQDKQTKHTTTLSSSNFCFPKSTSLPLNRTSYLLGRSIFIARVSFPFHQLALNNTTCVSEHCLQHTYHIITSSSTLSSSHWFSVRSLSVPLLGFVSICIVFVGSRQFLLKFAQFCFRQCCFLQHCL